MVTITESGNWIAPVDGWYKFKIKGAGGGGMGGGYHTHYALGGGSGGEGGTTIAYEKLLKGDIVSISIGKGGKGGSAGVYAKGTDGEDSMVIANGHSYIGGGGFTPTSHEMGGEGGSGTIWGITGQQGEYAYGNGMCGTPGTGHGGKPSIIVWNASPPAKALTGGGGAGGGGVQNSYGRPGGDGGDGIVWIEYYDSTK